MAAMARVPIILGHEGVGIVVKLGATAARSQQIKLGDRVAIGNINSACQACQECHEGREHHCKDYVQSGGMKDGCYAEYGG